MEQLLAGWFPGTLKDTVPGDCKFSVKMCNTWIIKKTDDELDININFILYVIVLPFSSSLFIGTEKVMYFLYFVLNIQVVR